MRVHVLQHVPFEGLGSMETWLSQRGAEIRYTRFLEPSQLPDPGTVDLVIAMGGPMSVNDEQEYNWLKQEKAFVRQVIHQGLPMLGVCLGAQMIANALGARVFPNEYKEIGWFPIEAVDNIGDFFRFPRQTTVFHWHGETFDLPDGAVRLAGSTVCKNQAFQIGRNVIGLQFHLETTPESADLIIRNCRDELVEGPYVQTEHTLRSAPESSYAGINKLMDDLLTYITR